MTKLQITYADILESAKNQKGLSVRQMYQIIKLSGIDCSQRSFYNFVNGSQVPDVIKGRAILDELEIEYDDKSLNDIIEYSTINKKSLSGQSTYTTSISISLNKLIEYVDDENKAFDLMSERVRETSNNFSDYINRLIRFDLKHNILDRKEEV